MKCTASKTANPEGHWSPVLLYVYTFICRTEPTLCQIKHCLPHIHIHIWIVQVSTCAAIQSHIAQEVLDHARAHITIVQRGLLDGSFLEGRKGSPSKPWIRLQRLWLVLFLLNIDQFLNFQFIFVTKHCSYKSQLSNSAIYYNHAQLATPKNTQTPTDTLISTINGKEQYAAEFSPTHKHKLKTRVYCHEWIFTSEQVIVPFEVRKCTKMFTELNKVKCWGWNCARLYKATANGLVWISDFRTIGHQSLKSIQRHNSIEFMGTIRFPQLFVAGRNLDGCHFIQNHCTTLTLIQAS